MPFCVPAFRVLGLGWVAISFEVGDIMGTKLVMSKLSSPRKLAFGEGLLMNNEFLGIPWYDFAVLQSSAGIPAYLTIKQSFQIKPYTTQKHIR
jgi:hypothetical protein